MFDELAQHASPENNSNPHVITSIDELWKKLRAAEGIPIRSMDLTGRTAEQNNKGGQGGTLEESILQFKMNSDPNPDLLVGGGGGSPL